MIKYDQPKVPWPAKKLRVSSWPLTRKEFHSEKDGTFPSNSDVGQYYVMVLQPTQKKLCHIMSRSQNFLEEGEEEAIHHNVLPLDKKQFIVQNFMFLGSYHKLYMTLLFRISFRKKKENESSWAEVGRAIYRWFQTIFVSLSPRTLRKMNIGLETKVASQPSYQRSRPKPAIGERGAMERATCTRRRGFLCSAFDDGEWTMAS